MSKSKVLGVLGIVAFIIAAGVAWVVITNSDTDETADELPTDLTEIFNTAIVTRADVSDEADLTGTLRYQGAVDLVHRVDVEITEVTTTVEVPVIREVTTEASTSDGQSRTGAATTAGEPGTQTVTELVTETVTETVETPGERTVTGLPQLGAIIEPGQALYETDSTPVFTAIGDTPAWRTLDSTTSGSDVAQLQAFLSNGGWATEDFEEEGLWSTALTTAVQVWQNDTGQSATGLVALGDLWFIPGPIRITEIEATEGVVVVDGDPILSYTSQERAIEARVGELPDGLLEAGELRVRLPGAGEVPATLRSVAGIENGFDLIIDVESTEGVADVDGLEATVSWTTNEIVDALTLPPEALRRVDTGEYLVDILVGDSIETTAVDVVGQAGRLVAVSGIEERAQVLIP